MSFLTQSQGAGISKNHGKATIWLIAASVGVFVLGYLFEQILAGVIDPPFHMFRLFGLSRHDLLGNIAIFQPVTYMFLHGGVLHLLFNMLIIWIFGREIEESLGRTWYLALYFGAGVAGGLLHIVFSTQYVVGASGAVYGLLLAFAVLWPRRQILFFFLFPVKAVYYVIIVAAVQFMLTTGGGGGVSHWAHIGGLAGGVIVMGILKRGRIKASIETTKANAVKKRHRALVERRIAEKNRVDALLEKISKDGMERLSRREKAFLDRASKKYY